ncbi:MAG: hypothetical protein ACI9R3_005869 [Verrucomicrobiales bacterium]|jgi:hypothetical protein
MAMLLATGSSKAEILVNSALVNVTSNEGISSSSHVWNHPDAPTLLSATSGATTTDAEPSFSADANAADLGTVTGFAIGGPASGTSRVLSTLDITVVDDPAEFSLSSAMGGTQGGTDFYAQLYYDVIQYTPAGQLVETLVSGFEATSTDGTFSISQAAGFALPAGRRYLIRIQQTLYGQGGTAAGTCGISLVPHDIPPPITYDISGSGDTLSVVGYFTITGEPVSSDARKTHYRVTDIHLEYSSGEVWDYADPRAEWSLQPNHGPFTYYQYKTGQLDLISLDNGQDQDSPTREQLVLYLGTIADDGSFGPPPFGTYEFSASIIQTGSVSETLTSFTLSEHSSNTAPTACVGLDQSIRADDTVNLDGSASFDDNTASALLSYSWSFSSLPAGSSAVLSGANTATPSFVADVADTYIAQLIVTDEGGLTSDPAFATISSNNLAPTAVATVDFSLAIVGEAVNFDGSGSTDPETDSLTYSWSITAAPAGSTATLIGAGTANPTLTPDLDGVYEVTLDVADFLGFGTPAVVVVTATTALGFAENVIVQASDLAAALNNGQVTTKGNQRAFGNFLAQAISKIQAGNIAGAIDKLEKAIARTDGCFLRGSVDGNGQGRDWITDCDAQLSIYDLLDAAVDALTP